MKESLTQAFTILVIFGPVVSAVGMMILTMAFGRVREIAHSHASGKAAQLSTSSNSLNKKEFQEVENKLRQESRDSGGSAFYCNPFTGARRRQYDMFYASKLRQIARSLKAKKKAELAARVRAKQRLEQEAALKIASERKSTLKTQAEIKKQLKKQAKLQTQVQIIESNFRSRPESTKHEKKLKTFMVEG